MPTRAIEDAGLLEILQSPGPAVGPWSLFDPLLDPTSAEFRFLEPLGQSREVKTALSGLFGRFVSRAYATRFLGFTHFAHVGTPPMRLSGPMRGEVRRVHGRHGDMPDWIAWGPSIGMAIIEAKGSHARVGFHRTLRRAFAQAERAEILSKGGRARFKRYAIATRWGFAAPLNWEPLLWVQDPEENGDAIPQKESSELQAGVIRLHCANLFDRLALAELAGAFHELASTPSRGRYVQARTRGLAALEAAPLRTIVGSRSSEPQDELVGSFVTRGGVFAADELSAVDQRTLSRLKMRPVFVGIERGVLAAAIRGDIQAIESRRRVASPTDDDGPRQGPQDDGTGGWIVRIDEDAARIE